MPFSFPSIRVFSNELALGMGWSKYWSFSFSNSPSNEYSFRIDWFDLLEVQVTLKSLFQHHNLKVSILWCSPFSQLLTWLMEKPWGFPGSTSGEEPACHCRRCKKCKCDPWSGRSCGGGHGNWLQHSCLENPMDRGAWRAKFIGFQRTGHNWSDLVCMFAP